MRKFLFILSIIFSCSTSLFASVTEVDAFKSFHNEKWNDATLTFYKILKTDTPLSSSEQYGRAIISSALAKDSVKTYFFIQKLNEHSGFTENYLTTIDQALDLEKKMHYLEPVLLYICRINEAECANTMTYIFEKYSKEARYEDAYRLLNKLVIYYPNDNALLYKIVNLDILLGNTDDAILYAKQALVNDPHSLDGNLYLGNIFLRKSQNELESVHASFKNKKGNLKRSDLVDLQLSVKDIIVNDLYKAQYYLEKADKIQSNSYIRNNLNWIKELKENNTKALLKLKLIDVQTLLP